MKGKPLLLVLLLATAIHSIAAADEPYPFSGHIDLKTHSGKLIAGPVGRQLEVNIIQQQDQSLALDAQLENVSTPFFEITAHLKGAVEIDKKTVHSQKISGRIVQELDDKSSDRADEGFVLDFQLVDGILHVDKFALAGMTGKGFINTAHPFEMDFRFGFQDVDLMYALCWLRDGTKKVETKGTVSGFAQWAGTPDKLSVRAQLVSQKGSIQKFSYDLLSLHLQGIYPVLELAGSTVTKSSGFSFDLDGQFDFNSSADLKTQFQAIKKIPLIKENALQSQWILKRFHGSNDDGKTETKFFLKKDKSTGSMDQDDSELFGMEKKIGF